MAVKEATHNVIKHAKATEITLGMALENGELRVCIKDNGVGFDPAKLEDSFGNGLNNMNGASLILAGAVPSKARPARVRWFSCA